MKNRKLAFTLVELMIVVLVVAILATIGIPGYLKSKKRAIQKEGISSVKLIAAAERIYRMERDSYFYYPNSGAISTVGDINDNLKLFLNTSNWTYTLTNTGGVIQIQAANSSGCTYTISTSNLDVEPTPSGCI